MSSTLVVLNVRLPCLVCRTQTRRRWCFTEVWHRHWTSVPVLAMHAATSLLYFQWFMQANRKSQEKHTFTTFSAAKHPKHITLTVTDTREKPVDFFNAIARASTLAPAIILQTWFLCKSFRSCRIYNFLHKVHETINLLRGYLLLLISRQLHVSVSTSLLWLTHY